MAGFLQVEVIDFEFFKMDPLKVPLKNLWKLLTNVRTYLQPIRKYYRVMHASTDVFQSKEIQR